MLKRDLLMEPSCFVNKETHKIKLLLHAEKDTNMQGN